MGKVFDALQRAGEERAQAGQKALDRWPPPRVEADKVENAATEGKVRPPLIKVPEIIATAKTWREKIEELLYGRDLSRLESYPLVALEKDSVAAEQYRILREKVRTLRQETSLRAITVTSPLKHDGKTMIAVNLAIALALGGDEEVVLIDGDLRSPDVHKYFGVRRYPGLADYLTDRSDGDLSSYVRNTRFPGLMVLPAGNTTDLAGELLAKDRMKSLLEEVQSAYPACQIIIDSPPVLATSDPLVLAREVGGVIMVIRAGQTRREYLKKAVEILNSSKLIGVVLNGAEFGRDSQYYHYMPVQPKS